MRGWVGVLTLSTGLMLTASLGCGARTGLVLTEEESGDADLGPAPDVFGPFPCTFSPVGEATPIRSGPDHSIGPQMEFGGGRLGILFTRAPSIRDPVSEGAAFCYSIPYDDRVCSTEVFLGGEGPIAPTPLTWHDDHWGACLRSSFLGIDADGHPIGSAHYFEAPYGVCTDLIWSGDNYVGAWIDSMEEPEQVVIARLDQHGEDPGPPLHEHASSGVPTRLAEDDGMEIAAWSRSSWLTIRRLDAEGPSLEVIFEAEGDIEHIDVALKRPVAGVLWSEHRGEYRYIFFRVVDMERGLMVSPVELGALEHVAGLEVVAVNEGFVIAWSDFSESGFDQVIAIPVGVDGWELRIFSPITLHHERHDPLFGELGAPSLAYDNRAVFVTFTGRVPSTGLYQVHFQQLDCHR